MTLKRYGAGWYNFPMRLIKRLMDVTIALAGLVLLSPLIVLISLLVIIFYGNPVLFSQQRPGYQGKPFYILKFRTMTAARDSSGNLLPDSQRLTGLGRFLRSFSLDELPELINILGGEMSFVGPRPLLMEYIPRYSSEQARRHEVPPGLTGWAQINGRNAADWQSRLAMDVWYVDHWSLWLDLKIIIITLWKVVLRQGINQPGQATVEYFKGNQD